MPIFEQLEQKIRRSSNFQSVNLFQDYMQYASNCRDQIQVYQYMEQNKIAKDQIQFWKKYLQALKKSCQYKQIIKILKKLKSTQQISSQMQFWEIIQFQQNLTYQLEKMIRQKRGRRQRSTQQFVLFSISKIQKEKRKIGGIEIYVDQQCRQFYRLEDYTQFILKHMMDQCESKRNYYLTLQSRKPLSFLGINQRNLGKLAYELIQLNKRNSLIFQQNNKSKNIKQKKFSISRKSNMINPEANYQTPKNENKKQNNIYKTPQNYQDQQNQNTSTLKNYSKKNYQLLIKSLRKKQKRLSNSENVLMKNFEKGQIYQAKNRTLIDILDDDTLLYLNSPQVARNEYVNTQVFNPVQLEYNFLQSQDDLSSNNILNKAFIIQSESQENQQNQNISLANDLSRDLSQQISQPFHEIHLSSLKNKILHNQQIEQNSCPTLIVCSLISASSIQSINSNAQNIYTTKKEQHDNRFKRFLEGKQRKVFQELKQEDFLSISNVSSSQILMDEGFLQNIPDIQKEALLHIVQQIQRKQNQQIEMRRIECQNQNLVLQTLRKQKLNQILMNQSISQLSNSSERYFTHSDRKYLMKNKLPQISQEKSYNSQRKLSQISFKYITTKQKTNQINNSINKFYSQNKE